MRFALFDLFDLFALFDCAERMRLKESTIRKEKDQVKKTGKRYWKSWKQLKDQTLEL